MESVRLLRRAPQTNNIDIVTIDVDITLGDANAKGDAAVIGYASGAGSPLHSVSRTY